MAVQVGMFKPMTWRLDMEGGDGTMARVADARIAIRISRLQKKALEEQAQQDGRSVSNLILQKLFRNDDPSGKKRPGHSN